MDIDELKRLAEEATPGPWTYDKNLGWAYPQTRVKSEALGRSVANFVDGKPQFFCTIGKAEREWANAAFIAAANPQNVLALITEVQTLRAELADATQAKQNTCGLLDRALEQNETLKQELEEARKDAT